MNADLNRTPLSKRIVFIGSTISEPLSLDNGCVFSVYFPTFVGSTLTALVELPESGEFVPIQDTAVELPVAVTAGVAVTMPMSLYNLGVDKIKFVSNASETTQGWLLGRA